MARNDGINRTSARNQCVCEASIGKIEGHNERENVTYTNPDIIADRSWMNIHYKLPSAGYAEIFSQMEQDGQISTRGLKPDADHYCEMVFDVNSAYFHNHGGYEYAKEFFAEAYKAAVNIVGDEKYVLSAVMHADERNRPMSEALGYDVFHYHLHVVYIPVVEKQIKWTKRCKDPRLAGTVKETIMQVSASKKWKSDPVLDKSGKPMKDAQGRVILKKSYSLLQDWFYDHMRAAGYTDIQRGEKGSSEEHLKVLQFKSMKEKERLAETQAMCEQAKLECNEMTEAVNQAKAAEASALQSAMTARAEAVRYHQESDIAEEVLKEIEKKKQRAQQAAAQAGAEADTAQALVKQISAQADKEEKRLNKLLGQKQDVESAVRQLREGCEMLRAPKLFESSKDYLENAVKPMLKKMLNWCREAVYKLHNEQTEHRETKQRLMRAENSLERFEEKATMYDNLEKVLGVEQIRNIIAESRSRSHDRKPQLWRRDPMR